jgi:UDP-glucose 4-epimerase
MTILITGGTGYIGSHTAKLLQKKGFDVIIYDNLVRGHRAAIQAPLIVGELEDTKRLHNLFSSTHIDGVLHLAGYAYVGESVANPDMYYRGNLVAGIQLLHTMYTNDVTSLVYASSCSVYGDPQKVPVYEDDIAIAKSPYGKSKLMLEQIIQDYSHAYNFATIGLRYFNVAGAAMDGSIGEDHNPDTRILSNIIKTGLGIKKVLEIYGANYNTPDKTAIRSYVHVDDVAQANLLSLEKVLKRDKKAINQVYNISLERGFSNQELINAYEEVTQTKVPIVYKPRRAGDADVIYANIHKAKKLLKWQPKYSLEDMVNSTYNWYRKHPNGFTV